MRDDLENYKWGLFYFNPSDSRLIVQKRNRLLGWTLNFANPYAYLLLLGIIGFAILMGTLKR